MAGERTFVQSVGEITAQWYPVFRRQLGVSPGAYWSSIGLGLGAPFSAVWNLAEPHALCQLAQGWLEQFQNDANRFIDWIPAVFGEQASPMAARPISTPAPAANFKPSIISCSGAIPFSPALN